MHVIADLHLHSRFSRAVSQNMTIPVMNDWARHKGIDLVATGDWTHPIWFRELEANLIEDSPGIYQYKAAQKHDPRFLLSVEISSIYSQGGKTRRIHYVIFAPSLSVVQKINQELTKRGVNLLSDGRPITGLSAKDVLELVLSIDEKIIFIPAHIWTPWFSLFGSMSGFDSLEECFGNLSQYIYAIETGLSSDPAMNWRIKELASRQIVSFSDAHSPTKLGREATVFDLENLSFTSLRKAIIGDSSNRIAYTIEFYPEEGKYHYTGHRHCQVVYSPKQARKKGLTCPVCGKPLTVGVMSRVETLASEDIETSAHLGKTGVRWIKNKTNSRPPYVMLVPLMEILAEVFACGVKTKKVQSAYDRLIQTFGSEFNILLKTPLQEIKKYDDNNLSQAISQVRSGNIAIAPGYDGIFGKLSIQTPIDQSTLF